MPLNLSQLSSNSARARVDYGADGDINIVYRPGNITEKSIRQLAVLQDTSQTDLATNLAAVNTLLRQLVVSWDLERDGVPVPLSEDALAEVPIDVRGDVLRAVFEDAQLNPTTGTSSPPTSPAS